MAFNGIFKILFWSHTYSIESSWSTRNMYKLNSQFNKIVPGVFENFNLFDFEQYTYRLFKLVLLFDNFAYIVSYLKTEGFHEPITLFHILIMDFVYVFQ